MAASATIVTDQAILLKKGRGAVVRIYSNSLMGNDDGLASEVGRQSEVGPRLRGWSL